MQGLCIVLEFDVYLQRRVCLHEELVHIRTDDALVDHCARQGVLGAAVHFAEEALLVPLRGDDEDDVRAVRRLVAVAAVQDGWKLALDNLNPAIPMR